MSDTISNSQNILKHFFGTLADTTDYKPIIGEIGDQLQEYNEILKDKSEYLEAQLEKLAADYLQKYKSEISRLKTEIKKIKKPMGPSSFVGAGSTTFAYAINNRAVSILYGLENNGKKLPSEEIFGMLRKVLAGILATGVKGTPEILGYSLQDGSIIFELAPGHSQIRNNIGETENYTNKELVELIRIIIDIHSRGLCIDYYPDNLIYNKDSGFSIIDLCLQKNKKISAHQDVMALRFMLIGKARLGADRMKRRLESLNLGLRILEIVKNNFPKLLNDFRLAKNPILSIGDTNVYAEFDADNNLDREFLIKAKKIISS